MHISQKFILPSFCKLSLFYFMAKKDVMWVHLKSILERVKEWKSEEKRWETINKSHEADRMSWKFSVKI